MSDPRAAASSDQSQTTHFGFKDVPLEDKAGMVHGVFTSVASSYDRMNDVMSFGVHRLWKAHLINCIRPRAGERFLDVAGGTGDIAFAIGRAAEQEARRRRLPIDTRADVTICDLTESMLVEGQARAQRLSNPYPQYQTRYTWLCGTATGLALPDRQYDCYTISFGLRNVDEPQKALNEAYRVLKPGGRFFCLEFSQVVLPGFDKLYDAYSFNVIPRMGQMVAGDRESYQYLVESIRKFAKQSALEDMMRQAGFERVSHTNLSGGIAAIHTGWRL